MKIIDTGGIYNITPVEGIDGWYYGLDYTYGDLYEAEGIYRSGSAPGTSSLALIRHPTGEVVKLPAGPGRCWGEPVGFAGRIYTLLVDFPAGVIEIGARAMDMRDGEIISRLPLGSVEDCYNLMLRLSPPMLTRSSGDEFEIVWPERSRFKVGRSETFLGRYGERLYFSAWYEEPEYREEVVVRDAAGAVLERFTGALWVLPGGQAWVLR